MTKKSKVSPRVVPEQQPTTVRLHVPSDFYVKAQGLELNAERLQNMMPAGIAYLLNVGLTTSLNNAAYLSKGDREKLIAKGKDPDLVAAERAQKRLMDITAGVTTSGRHVFQKIDIVEKMVRQIASERIECAIATMAAMPDKDKLKAMTRHLIKLQGDELRQEAEARIAQTRAIGSALIEKLMQEEEEHDDEDSGDSSSFVTMEAAE
jgi:hypothetical protein